MRRVFLTIIFITFSILSYGEDDYPYITHYSVEDGLSENHVLCILQDQKGLMWFGTFSGLDRFDGYSFKNFKGDLEDEYQLLNYKIDQLKEDKHGYLWVRSNDINIYRFDPSTETYLQMPQCLNEFKNYRGGLNRFSILRDSSIWLYNMQPGSHECFRVTNGQSAQEIDITAYSSLNGDLLSDTINLIYCDSAFNTWILSPKGINHLKKDESKFTVIDDSLEIYTIYELDKDIYFGGRNGYFLKYSKAGQVLNLIETPASSDIIEILPVSDTKIVLISNGLSIYIYDTISKQFEKQTLDREKCNRIYNCYRDNSGRLWFVTEYAGAVYFDPIAGKLNYLPVTDKWYTSIISQSFYLVQDTFKNVWVQIRNGGLYKFNEEKNQLESIIGYGENENNISNVAHIASADKQGNLWVSGYLQGINKVVYRRSPFNFIKPSKNEGNILANEIRSVFQDSKNYFWVGAKNGNIYLLDENKKMLGMLCSDGTIGTSKPLTAAIYSIMEDHTGHIWLASKGAGIFRLTRKSERVFEVENYRNERNNPYSLSSNAVYSILQDHENRIWIGAFNGGLNIVDTVNNKIRFINGANLLKNYPLSFSSKIRCIAEDSDGRIYIGSTNGLLICRLKDNDYSGLGFERFTHQPGDPNSISGNDIQYILPSKTNGNIYITSSGGGVDKINGGFTAENEIIFDKVEAIPTDIIYTLNEDSAGVIWMSAQTRIIKYNQHNARVEIYKPYTKNAYFLSEAAACFTKNNEILFGTSIGLMYFDPEALTKSDFTPRIFLSQLQIFNTPVEIGDGEFALPKALDTMDSLTLSHKQNTFSISYAAIDYKNTDDIQYAYYLEGLETGWNYVGDQRIARYVNLPKGKYVFNVKSTNSDGEWVENVRTISIEKRPSFWESNLGIAFYVLSALFFSAIAGYIIFVIYRLRNNVAVEQRISNMKLRFFTDISHELRTPLTLIVSPVNNLLRKEPLTKTGMEQLKLVQKNTSRLLRLINQILDFRKIQNKKLKLLIEPIQIEDILHEIVENFHDISEEKNISVSVTNLTKNSEIWADRDKIEKIFFNLISNAYKFSLPNKKINIDISEEKNGVCIAVKDQGIGISVEKLKMLFGRFESFAASKGALQPSSGIGLSLTKELVELHKGKISAESQPGKGTGFTVVFKKGRAHYGKEAEIVLPEEKQTETRTLQEEVEIDDDVSITEILSANEPKNTEGPKLIIAEDNQELREFLQSALSQNYEVKAAVNGKEALSLAESFSPDIIISDLMMPDMDGLELSKIIKSNINTSHIPFILLTAKTNLDSKLEAMKLGVDDYITKPFNLSYLEARIVNLLKIREQLQSYFKDSLTSGVIPLSKPNVTNMDEDLIQKIMGYLEENFEKSEINVENIAEYLNLSRSSFFKKLKSLTGMAPVEFIREFRLQRSIQLIDAGHANVSQLSYAVGINDPRYFSKCFKQKFGITPKEYIRNQSENS